MAKTVHDAPAEGFHRALFDKSYRRMRRRGLTDDQAMRVATVVAERVTARRQAPDVKSDKELARLVGRICDQLVRGRSFYALIREKPYLATGRIDRLVAAARYVRPPVAEEMANAARRITKLERLSGAVAVIFMGVALGTLGLWPALGVGVAVAVGGEVYVQAAMPTSARLAAAQARVPYIAGVAALAALVYFGYQWVMEVGHHYLHEAGLVVAALIVAFVVPGLTLATMVGLSERMWRRGLEKRLVQALKEGSGDLSKTDAGDQR